MTKDPLPLYEEATRIIREAAALLISRDAELETPALEAGAAAEAEVDGRDFASLGRGDRERYLSRFRLGLEAYQKIKLAGRVK